MTWRVWVALLVGTVSALGCGSTASHPNGAAGGSGATPASGGATSPGAGTGQGGSGGATSAGTSAMAGVGSSGGAAPSACMARTTNHLAGTRLKIHEVLTDEGDRAWDGFYDSQTGENCSDALASDGKVRCLPLSRFQTQIFYADAACSDPVYLQSDTCPAKYLELYDYSDPCAAKEQLFLPGAAYTGPVFQGTPTACGPSAAAQPVLVRKGATIDPTTFVELEPGQLQEPGRIARIGYKSADGAFSVRGYHDSVFDADCSFGLMRDGKQHCIPRSGGDVVFSDAACQTSLLGVSSACGQTPEHYFSRDVGDGCDLGRVAMKTGQPYTGPLFGIDRGASGSCMAVPNETTPESQLFTSMDLPDSAVPEVTLTTVSTDPGRLKPMYRTSSDGSCSFYDFWDSDLQVECYLDDAQQGGYRCYPDTGPANTITRAFSDAGCTLATDYFSVKTCFADQVPKYATSSTYGECGARTRSVRPVSARMDGAVVALFQGAPGACAPIVADPDSSYFTLGAALPDSTFVSGQRAPL